MWNLVKRDEKSVQTFAQTKPIHANYGFDGQASKFTPFSLDEQQVKANNTFYTNYKLEF